MYIQPCNNRNIAFGTKVITTQSANETMSKYTPEGKRFMHRQFAELEKNQKRDVVVIDSCPDIDDVQMTCYKMKDGKLYKSIDPSRCGVASKAAFDWNYALASDYMTPVKPTTFDKYNPTLEIIKDYCEE